MTKTIYLHIGMHKTGSTTIQAGLYHNQEQLEARGYAYPHIDKLVISHVNVFRELRGQSNFNPSLCTLSDLQTFIKQTHYNNIIISSETFSFATVKELRKLATYFSGHQVKVVVYLRRQDQFVQSMWAQRVKTGNTTLSFEEWFNGIIFKQPRLSSDSFVKRDLEFIQTMKDHINYESFIGKYASVFGQENIMLQAYERPYMNSNIFADFLQFIGMDDVAWIPETPKHNISPSIKTLEFLRHVGLGWQEKTNNTHILDILMSQYLSKLEQFADRLGWNDQRLNLIDQARYDRAMQVYGEGNDRIAQTYLGRDKLFREPFTDRTVTTFDTSEFQNDELIAMMQEMGTIHLQMLKKPKKKIQHIPHKQSLATKLMRHLQSLLQR